MKKYLIILLFIPLVAGAVWWNPFSWGQKAEPLGDAPRVFTSSQIGTSPANGDVLQTDGSLSTWVSPGSLGITGGGSAAWEKYTGLASPLNIITPTTSGASIFVSGNATTTESLTVGSLQNCDTIDTDGAGLFKCGSDETGGSGSGSNWNNDSINLTPTTTGIGVIMNAATTTGNFVVASSTADFPALYVDSLTGYVGLGTDNPQMPLHIEAVGDFGEDGAIHFECSDITGVCVHIHRLDGGAASPNPTLSVHGDNVADKAIQVGLEGDTIRRLSLTAGGYIEFGAGGATARDARLYRSAAGVLTIDDTAAGAANLVVLGNATSTHIAATGGNSDQWNTAYGWGNHAVAGYASSSGMFVKYGTLAELQGAVSNDFHNLGGTDANTTYTAGDALTLNGTDFDFDGGATPGGSLGGTWASPTIDDLFVLNTTDTMTGGLTVASATTTGTLYVGNLTTASCDVKATAGTGLLYCGNDASGASAGAAWQALGVPGTAITPTTTGTGIVVSAASSTISNLVVSDSLSGMGFTNAWNTTANASSTFVTEGDFPALFATRYNATTTQTNFGPNWNNLFNATSTWAGFAANFANFYNATTTQAGFQNQFNNAINASSTIVSDLCANGQIPKSNGTGWDCGTDLQGVGGGGGAAWEVYGDPDNNIITPTSSGAIIQLGGDINFTEEDNHQILINSTSAEDGGGGNLTIKAGDANGSGTAGVLTLQGGNDGLSDPASSIELSRSDMLISSASLNGSPMLNFSDNSISLGFDDGTTWIRLNEILGEEPVGIILDGNATTTGAFAVGGLLYVKPDTGNVGIGTESPQAKLSIVPPIGSVTDATTLLFQVASTTDTEIINAFTVDISGNATTTNRLTVGSGSTAGNTQIEFYDNNNLLKFVMGREDSTALFKIASSSGFSVNDLFVADATGNATTTRNLAAKGDLYVLGQAVITGKTTTGSFSSGSATTTAPLYLTGLAAAVGTPSTLCMDANKQVTLNAALTCTVSSKRFKHDIQPLDVDVKKLINSLQPSQFLMNGTDEPALGLIAEEVLKVEPRLVAFDSEGRPNSVRYEQLTAVLVKALQDIYRDGPGAAAPFNPWNLLGLLGLLGFIPLLRKKE